MTESLRCWFSKTGEKNITIVAHALSNVSAICFVTGITGLLNVIANTFVVYKFYQTRARQPVSNTLLLFLASLDLLKGAVGQPLFILAKLLEYHSISSCALGNIIEAILCLCLGYAFLLTTIVITSERFFAIMYPLYHRVYSQKKLLVYTSLALLVAWAILVVFFHRVWYFKHLYVVYFCIIAFGLVYTLSVYVKIFSVSRHSQKMIIQHGDTATSRKRASLNNGGFAQDGINRSVVENNKHKKQKTMSPETPCHMISKKVSCAIQTFNLTAKEKKTIFRMLSIVGVLYLTSLPLLSTFAYQVIRGHDQFFEIYLYPWSTTVMFFCGVINPYIYCYRNEHFRTRKPAPKRPPVFSSFNTSSERARYNVSQQERP